MEVRSLKSRCWWQSSCCGVMGLAVSWEHWDMGSIPSPAQQVKDLALPQLWLRLRWALRSDPWPESSICWGVTPPKKCVGGAVFLLEASGEDSFPYFSSFWRLLTSLGFWPLPSSFLLSDLCCHSFIFL